MEQQPKVVREEINEESKKEVVEVEKEDPSPVPDPKPSEGNDGKDNGDQKDEKVKDLIITETGSLANNVEVNGDGIESNNSATPPSRSKKSVRWSRELVVESEIPVYSEDHGSDQFDNYSSTRSIEPSSSFNMKDKMDSVKDLLGRWRRNVGEVTRKAEDFAGNTWQHLKTSPSFADAALGRLAQGTKVLAEGGYEKIFRQTFETVPEEQLQNSYACYLSTSAGPVMGVLYVSTAKLAFCSDNPLSYKVDDNTEWSFYKVVIPLHQLKAVNPSTSRTNSAEKYIQVISVDNHEFWYMGFLNYEGAVKCLQEVLEARYTQAV